MIGARVTRREDERVLRGRTQYVDDIARPDALEVAFVRSSYAHAAIAGIDVAAAGSAEGVTAVVTAADLRGLVRPFPVGAPDGVEVAGEPHPVLAEREVRYVGQAVAAVVAGSRALAEDAAELVDVAYEPRQAVVDPESPEAAVVTRWTCRSGDVDGVFAAAHRVVTGRYGLPRLAAVPLEPRGAIAEHDADRDLVTVWCSAQDPHRPRAQLAHILGREPEGVRVVVPDVGGAFGSKGVVAAEVAAVAAAAILLGRPLRWTEDRVENLIATYQGRGMSGELELALSADGEMLGLRAAIRADLGAYLLPTTAIPPHTAGTLITGCYDIPAVDVEVVGVATHKVPTGPYRGAGRPDAAYMVERLADDAARQLRIDPVGLRRRNVIRSFPHRTPLGLEYDSGDYERCLELAMELCGRDFPAGELTGAGVALYVERAGGGWESAEIERRADGRFVVSTSACAHGQGHETTFAQIAAERLGCAPADVEVRFGDSGAVPPGVGTFGSRSVAVAGSAVAVAADRLVGEGAVRASARFESPRVFSSGAAAAVVAIDPGTGRLHVRRVVAVDDAGVIINPLLTHGQVVGEAVQALGECLTEGVVYDEDGENLSATLMAYSLMTAADVPPIVTGEVVSPSPHNPLGAKGVGEGGAVGALAAVANAVADALGGRHVDPPYTAEKLWRALRSR